MINVLIVDDEPTQLKMFGKVITNLGYNCLTMTNGMQVVDMFMNKKVLEGISASDLDVMLLDVSMPDMDGLTVLKQISVVKGNTQVIVLTADKNANSATTAIRYGAVDYVTKGEEDVVARLTTAINNAIEKRNLKYQVSNLERKDKNQVTFFDIIGKSEAISDSIKSAKKIANSLVPILIEGPEGSGKELLARAIHGSGIRSGKPFVMVKCVDLANGKAEEEIFGSDRVMSDGIMKNIGKLREANSGTIFFKKIDALKPDLQLKLLHFMQEGEFTPLYGKKSIQVDTRMIFSTSRDLKKLVSAKKFREDLYYLLLTHPIYVPSLKERGKDDIKLLTESFCREYSIDENKKIKSLSKDALYLLYHYDWEDNIRQLKNMIFRAVVSCDGDLLQTKHFPYLLSKSNNSLVKSKAEIKKTASINSELIDIFDDQGNCKTIDVIEEEIIKRLANIYHGNFSKVAKELEIGRSTIYRKLKILTDIEEDEKS